MQKSISKNGVFYAAYNVLNVIFPLLSGIYAAHVLLPETIGDVTYASNIAQYFVILAFLGIPTYGLREVSKARNNKQELNKVYSELFAINLISTALFFGVYCVLIFLIPQFRDNIVLYLIAGISIGLNAINISWLYEGLEEFKFISLRNIFFKTLVFVILITMVRKQEDYLVYACLSAIGTAGNYLINIFYSPRFVRLSFKNLNLRRHLKSIILLVVVNLAIEIYSLIDTTMLGFFCSKDHVTYYYYGHKMNIIFLTLLNTFTVVLVPRLAACFDSNKNEFNRLLCKGLKTIVIFAVPMITGVQFVADFLICKIYGDSYISSSYVLRILIFILIISPIGYLLGSRVLLVAKQEKKMVFAVSAGALVNVIGNFFLIQSYQEIGAAIASVISEIVIMVIYVRLGHRYYKYGSILSTVLKVLLATGVMCLVILSISLLPLNEWIRVLITIFSGVIVYGSMLIIMREDISVEYLNRLKVSFLK